MASIRLALLSQFRRPFFHPIPTLYVHKIVSQVGRAVIPSCVSEHHVCARQKAKKGQTSDPLELESLLSHCVGAGNQAQLSYLSKPSPQVLKRCSVFISLKEELVV